LEVYALEVLVSQKKKAILHFAFHPKTATTYVLWLQGIFGNIWRQSELLLSGGVAGCWQSGGF
jgi:hypothetical protein